MKIDRALLGNIDKNLYRSPISLSNMSTPDFSSFLSFSEQFSINFCNIQSFSLVKVIIKLSNYIITFNRNSIPKFFKKFACFTVPNTVALSPI